MANKDESRDAIVAERLRKAFLAGPPQEVCMILDQDKLRPFEEHELKSIGAYPVDSPATGPREMELYGKPEPGWMLVLEDD